MKKVVIIATVGNVEQKISYIAIYKQVQYIIYYYILYNGQFLKEMFEIKLQAKILFSMHFIYIFLIMCSTF